MAAATPFPIKRVIDEAIVELENHEVWCLCCNRRIGSNNLSRHRDSGKHSRNLDSYREQAARKSARVGQYPEGQSGGTSAARCDALQPSPQASPFPLDRDDCGELDAPDSSPVHFQNDGGDGVGSGAGDEIHDSVDHIPGAIAAACSPATGGKPLRDLTSLGAILDAIQSNPVQSNTYVAGSFKLQSCQSADGWPVSIKACAKDCDVGSPQDSCSEEEYFPDEDQLALDLDAAAHQMYDGDTSVSASQSSPDEVGLLQYLSLWLSCYH